MIYMRGVDNEPATRTGFASPSADGLPFCHVTNGHAPSPRSLHFVSLGDRPRLGTSLPNEKLGVPLGGPTRGRAFEAVAASL